MKTTFKANLGTSGIGSLPLIDGPQAAKFIFDAELDFPFWPQLPKRDFLEQMIPQYSEGMPGIVVDRQKETVRINPTIKYDELAVFYTKYMEEQPAQFAISEEYAAGLHAFLATAGKQSWNAVKGHITGPVTFATGISEVGKEMLYADHDLRDAAVKLLTRKAQWQIEQLRAFSDNIIIFVDEPVLAAFGSSTYVGISAEDVVALESEIFEAIRAAGGLSGIHVCGNSDWNVIIKTGVDILNFDAYSFEPRLSLYSKDVTGLFERGGHIAWGIVPTTPEDLKRETCASLIERFRAGVRSLTAKGLAESLVLERAILTPSCGCSSLSIPEAEKVFALLRELRAALR